MANPLIINKVAKNQKFHTPENQSKGILDDFAVRKDIHTRNTNTLTFEMPTGAGASKVLTSDANGTGTWQTAAGGSEATGSIKMFGSATPPTGWLNCDGTAVSRATYSDLFTVIGIKFGAGDGSTTFNVPEFDLRFPQRYSEADPESIGESLDTSMHQHAAITAGTPTGTITSHMAQTPPMDFAGAAGSPSDAGYPDHQFIGDEMGTHQHAAAEHTPPYLKVNFIIKT